MLTLFLVVVVAFNKEDPLNKQKLVQGFDSVNNNKIRKEIEVMINRKSKANIIQLSEDALKSVPNQTLSASKYKKNRRRREIKENKKSSLEKLKSSGNKESLPSRSLPSQSLPSQTLPSVEATTQQIKDTTNTTETGSISGSPSTTGINVSETAFFDINSTKSGNDSLVPVSEETPEYQNDTQNYTEPNNFTTTQPIGSTSPPTTKDHNNDNTFTTLITVNLSSETPATTLLSIFSTEPSRSETETTATSSSTTQTSKNDDNQKFDLSKRFPQCFLDNKIVCRNYQILCYGFGEIDCGNQNKSGIDINEKQLLSYENMFKLSLQQISNNEMLQPGCNQSQYLICTPPPLLNECYGRATCRKAKVSGPMEFWKVGLIAGLAAAGGITFILVAIVAYISLV